MQLEHKITVLKGKAEDQIDKIGQVDIIISEWMGYCLLFEGMLDSVINVRGKFDRKVINSSSKFDLLNSLPTIVSLAL